jgi:hypothetical protein
MIIATNACLSTAQRGHRSQSSTTWTPISIITDHKITANPYNRISPRIADNIFSNNTTFHQRWAERKFRYSTRRIRMLHAHMSCIITFIL